MVKDLLAILGSCGLDDKESQLYLSGLQLGSAPASEYAKASDINRITAYNTLEGLVRRPGVEHAGLVPVDRQAHPGLQHPFHPSPKPVSLVASQDDEVVDILVGEGDDAVHEVIETLMPYMIENPVYQKEMILERITGSPEEAEDLAQEVFLRLYERPLTAEEN